MPLITDPTWIFLIVLSIILFAPMLLERLHVPSIVGLIAAGILIGEHGFNVLARDGSFEIFGKVGLYYIMFLAALEMNLSDVRRILGRAATFGLLSFLIPMAIGVSCGLFLLHYALGPSLLIAAMFASHTLITYPIVMRYGLSRLRCVNIAVGGTIVADTLTLLVLAIVGGMFKEHSGQYYWVSLLLRVVGISAIIIYLFPRFTRAFFRRYEDAVAQYVFVLAIVFLSAGLMEFAGMEGILGAFLAGLAVNRLIPPTSPLMTHIEFLGNALFIPYFLIGVGMIINVGALAHTSFLIVAFVMVVGGIVSKWLATFAAQKLFSLTRPERHLMTGLTGSRAAATLAVALVGYKILLPNGESLLGDDVLNGSMVMILITCSVASFVTEAAARTLVRSRRRYQLLRNGNPQSKKGGEEEEIFGLLEPDQPDCFLIALSDPESVVSLTGFALMLRPEGSSAPLLGVNVVLDDQTAAREEGRAALERAQKMAQTAGVRMQTFSRWSVNVVSGISHAVKENGATDLIIGMHRQARLSDTYLGKVGADLIANVSRTIYLFHGDLPLPLVRHMHLILPSQAEFEPGFEAWAVRIAGMARQINCGVDVYSTETTLEALDVLWQDRNVGIRTQMNVYSSWHDFAPIAHATRRDHLVVFVAARRGSISWHNYIDHLPDQLGRYFTSRPALVIYPERPKSENPGAPTLNS